LLLKINKIKKMPNVTVAAEIVLSQEHTLDGRIVDAKAAVSRDKAPTPARYIIQIKYFICKKYYDHSTVWYYVL